jgi:SAM-dependent methyltransferase
LTELPAHRRSFRDPDAFLVDHDGRLFRAVSPHAVQTFRRVLDDQVIRAWMDAGRLVRTRTLPRSEWPAPLSFHDGECFEHERIDFVTYPGEWTPEMLASAGTLTLQLARALLPRGFQLKDATPANVLFRHASPVFVDLPSIVARDSGSCLWNARHQFEITFLLPLIASDEIGLPLAWSLANPVAGLSHEMLSGFLGSRRWVKPWLWRTVTLPAALGARAASSGSQTTAMKAASDKEALYILEQSLSGLERQLQRTAAGCARRSSHWHSYTATRGHYADADLEAKRAFVTQVVQDTKPVRTLDIGANTGEFSAIAAMTGEVVAQDIDERSVAAIWRRASETNARILPVVGNFGRPSPATGWRNGEMDSFLSRAAHGFDLVLMLAVVHHLRVTEGVPVAEQFDAIAEITRRHLLVEFVPVSDPMFAAIARGREPLYADCVRSGFESALTRHFAIERTQDLPNGRILYLAFLRPG